MARGFVNGDALTLAAGGLTGTNRSGTVGMLVRMYSATFDAIQNDTDVIAGRSGTSNVWALFAVGGKFFSLAGGGGDGFPPDKNTWVAIFATKPTGNSTIRYHLAAVGGAWTHVDSGSGGDGSTGIDNVFFGSTGIIGHGSFQIAAAAHYGSAVLNDAAIEALGSTDMANWMAGNPVAAWQFNQASTATTVTDLTGGGADQTALTGTTVVADPVGWAYFSSDTSEGTADVGVAVAVAAVGEADHTGTTDVGVALAVAAAGVAEHEGIADLGLTLSVAVTGDVPHEGAADVGVTLAVAGAGEVDRLGTADVGVVIDSHAEGPPSVVQNFIPASFAVVTGVGQCVIAELEMTPAGIPDRVCLIVPGSIVWDACDCGQFAQTITTEWPSSTFPAAASDQRATPCGPPMLVVTVTASIVRCVPTLDNNGKPPTCADLAEAALVLEQDRRAMREAVTCCLKSLRDAFRITDFTVGTSTTVGEQGGCAGVELVYQFGVNNICCG